MSATVGRRYSILPNSPYVQGPGPAVSDANGLVGKYVGRFNTPAPTGAGTYHAMSTPYTDWSSPSGSTGLSPQPMSAWNHNETPQYTQRQQLIDQYLTDRPKTGVGSMMMVNAGGYTYYDKYLDMLRKQLEGVGVT